jgi:hypothetical protein
MPAWAYPNSGAVALMQIKRRATVAARRLVAQLTLP